MESHRNMTYSKAADVNLWQDFKESFSFKPQFNVEEIFGGLPKSDQSAMFVKWHCYADLFGVSTGHPLQDVCWVSVVGTSFASMTGRSRIPRYAKLPNRWVAPKCGSFGDLAIA